jgi:hypothetical protein
MGDGWNWLNKTMPKGGELHNVNLLGLLPNSYLTDDS